MSFSEARYSPDERADFVATLSERFSGLPGVVSVGRSIGVPPNSGITFGEGLYVEGREGPAVEGSLIYPYLEAGPGFREHFGMDLLAGRDLRAADMETGTEVLVTRGLAERLGGVPDAVGTRFRLGTQGSYSTVIGIVDDVRLFGLDDRWGDEGLIRITDPGRDHSFVSLTVRTEGDPAVLMPELRRTVAALDANQPIRALATLDDEMWNSVARERFFATLMAVFAVLALVLASAGLYGVLAFYVGRRVREMGIRMALGAGAEGIRSMVVGSGMRLGVFGALLGIGVSLWGAGVVEEMLFDTSARDPWTLSVVTVVMLVVTGVASYLPARRATRIDVVDVLRAE